ncbi:MAG: hypothetical protein U1D65_17800 [Pseudomonas sp.]|nr:hypothetical protein [Pseudomonas sp.]MDZ4193848.1 hypothetical protein [Pseudomonas sp.]
MNDRELLELAAKAAGLNCQVVPLVGGVMVGIDEYGEVIFDPRTNDADSFRLAVRLGIFDDPRFNHFRSLERFSQQHEDDCYATRLAILRVAAEIGKAI